tara:strand:+ start:8406 stop:8807 length:402 start_codon:yes stop_codon:yes gene_type:complete
MSKGLEKYQERQAKLNQIGKDLARRAKSKCELCQMGGVSLRIYELAPLPQDPDLNKAIFICDGCLNWISKPNKINLDRWRILKETVWSEIPAVQVMSIRILSNIGKEQQWASESLENVYLDPEIEDWVSQSPI